MFILKWEPACSPPSYYAVTYFRLVGPISDIFLSENSVNQPPSYLGLIFMPVSGARLNSRWVFHSEKNRYIFQSSYFSVVCRFCLYRCRCVCSCKYDLNNSPKVNLLKWKHNTFKIRLAEVNVFSFQYRSLNSRHTGRFHSDQTERCFELRWRTFIHFSSVSFAFYPQAPWLKVSPGTKQYEWLRAPRDGSIVRRYGRARKTADASRFLEA